MDGWMDGWMDEKNKMKQNQVRGQGGGEAAALRSGPLARRQAAVAPLQRPRAPRHGLSGAPRRQRPRRVQQLRGGAERAAAAGAARQVLLLVLVRDPPWIKLVQGKIRRSQERTCRGLHVNKRLNRPVYELNVTSKCYGIRFLYSRS